MCDPTMLIIGSIIQGVGGFMGMQAQAENAEMQAALSEQQAKQVRMAGKFKGDSVTREAMRIGGQQRAAAAEGGLAMTGSVADVMDESAIEADLDVQTIMWNSRSQADNKKYEAEIFRQNASSARAAAPFAFLSPILGGAAQFPTAFGMT